MAKQVWDYDSDGSRDLIGHAEVTLPQLIENQVPVDRLIPMVNTMYPHKAPGGAAAKRSKKVLPHWIPLIHPPTKPKYILSQAFGLPHCYTSFKVQKKILQKQWFHRSTGY